MTRIFQIQIGNMQCIKSHHPYRPSYYTVLSTLCCKFISYELISSLISLMQNGIVEYPYRLLFHFGSWYFLLLLVFLPLNFGNKYENLGFSAIFVPNRLVKMSLRSSSFLIFRVRSELQ